MRDGELSKWLRTELERRIKFFDYEVRHGGNRDYLNARRDEATHIIELIRKQTRDMEGK
jgi:hypothetical protein